MTSKFKLGDKVRLKDRVGGYSQPDYSQVFTYGVGGDWDYTINTYEDDFELVEENKQRHVHYDIIMEWAANPSRVVEYYGKFTIDGEANWYDCPDNQPAWNPETRYRFKPEEPERVFPTTSLTDDELMEVYGEGYSTSVDSYRDIANAALKRYILEQEENT